MGLHEPTTAGTTSHLFVSCDKSGQNPIKGSRYKQIGANYDLCAAEYQKLSKSEQKGFISMAVAQTNSQVSHLTARFPHSKITVALFPLRIMKASRATLSSKRPRMRI